jgi:adenine phosphoribosyltransferase
MDREAAIRAIESKIRTIPDYPKQGIMFRDITPMLKDKEAFRTCIEVLKEEAKAMKLDYIVGIEARGFIIGSALAYALGLGFIPARKKGKLPYKSISMDYTLEYGTATLEMHEDSLGKGDRVLVVDDLLATGGSAETVGKLVRKLGARIEGYLFVIELEDLKGRERLKGERVISLVKFIGD